MMETVSTYVQHKNKRNGPWVIHAPRYVHQKNGKKIETDRKVHLHEGNS